MICLSLGDLHRLATVPLASLLRVPAVFIVCLAVTLGALVWSVIEPILQPHLVVVGRIIFIINRCGLHIIVQK